MYMRRSKIAQQQKIAHSTSYSNVAARDEFWKQFNKQFRRETTDDVLLSEVQVLTLCKQQFFSSN